MITLRLIVCIHPPLVKTGYPFTDMLFRYHFINTINSTQSPMNFLSTHPFYIKEFNNSSYFTIIGNILLHSHCYYILKVVGEHESTGTKTQCYLTTFTKIPWKFHTPPPTGARIPSSVTILLKHSS